LAKEELGIGGDVLLNKNWSNPREENGPVVEKLKNLRNFIQFSNN